jgi:hypothetical protein
MRDHGLETLLEEREYLSAQIGTLKDTETDPMLLFQMQRERGVLDGQIARHEAKRDA